MTENNAINTDVSKPDRPLGVWLLTIYALVFLGLLPLLLSIMMLLSGSISGNAISIIFPLILCAGIVISAIGAWQGNEKARKLFLVLITINYIFIAINNYLMLNSGEVAAELQRQAWGRVIRGVIYPIGFIWYFSKPSTKEFYS